MEIVRATREEIPAIDALLGDHELPPLPPAQPLSNLWVAREGGALVGAIALEVRGRRGLVRSLVVASAHRGTGLAKDLLSRVVSRSHELGLRDLYLLTESAAGFFAKRGFGEISRDAVPEEIRQTREFREQCPETATVMCMPLETRW